MQGRSLFVSQSRIVRTRGLMSVDCPGSCKRASCGVQGHGKVCRLHCSSCNPGDQRNPRGRPPVKKKRRLVRGAAVSYAEQDGSGGLVLDAEEEPQGADALQVSTVRGTLDRVLPLSLGMSQLLSRRSCQARHCGRVIICVRIFKMQRGRVLSNSRRTLVRAC